jgi:hypothetical protein
VALDVRCVHQTHGIRSGAEFKYGGITPLEVDSSMYAAGYRPQDQQTMWNAVRRSTAAMREMADFPVTAPQTPREAALQAASLRSRTPSAPAQGVVPSRDAGGTAVGEEEDSHLGDFVEDRSIVARAPRMFNVNLRNQYAGGFERGADDLKNNFDQFARSFDEILSKARLQENQVGLGLITDKGCKTIHKDAVKRMGTELLRGSDNTSVFEYKPENAINAVRKVLALDYKTNPIYEHKPSNGEPHVAILGLTATGYVGEVVELDGRVIHLTILETARA